MPVKVSVNSCISLFIIIIIIIIIMMIIIVIIQVEILTGKPTGKRPLGRPRRRWEDNIRMDLEKIESIYLYFPPSSQLLYICFCPVGLLLL